MTGAQRTAHPVSRSTAEIRMVSVVPPRKPYQCELTRGVWGLAGEETAEGGAVVLSRHICARRVPRNFSAVDHEDGSPVTRGGIPLGCGDIYPVLCSVGP